MSKEYSRADVQEAGSMKQPQDPQLVEDHTNGRGAPCGFCWEMLFAFSPSCQTCKLRPFGSAPCLDDMPDNQECPGKDCCPNGDMCCDVAAHEWPLAEIAIKMFGASH